jgi:nucleoside 2-deoxyribosyltransferase
MKKRIYLSGPMCGCSEAEKSDWRDTIIKECPEYEFFDPRDIDTSKVSEDEIVGIDTDSIMKSDICIFNVWKVSPGTMGELALASFFRKENLLIVPDRNIARHPWIISAGILYDDVQEVIIRLRFK